MLYDEGKSQQPAGSCQKKRDRLAISNGGSVVTRFIPQEKLTFPSKSTVSTDYHGEINLDVLSGLPISFVYPVKTAFTRPNTQLTTDSTERLCCEYLYFCSGTMGCVFSLRLSYRV